MSPLSSFYILYLGGPWPWLLYAFAFGYLLGSIPFGLVLTRLAGLGDVRTIGSGNIGATNVLRTGNKPIAAATFAADCLKGTAAVLIADELYGAAPAVAAGLGAFLGHLYPVWLRFKGGKGVATYLGVLLGLCWKAAAVFSVTWLTIAGLLKMSSLAALTASIAAPAYLFFAGRIDLSVIATLMSLLIFWRHRSNIRRLLSGEEPKIGASG